MARANRPKQTVSFLTKQYAKDCLTYEITCPFCMGNEHMTPKAILEYKSLRDPNAWDLRVIQNKYPAVTPLTCLNATKDNHHHIFADGRITNNEMPAVGHHEVCIENPQHNYIIATGNRESLDFMVRAWMERSADLHKDRFVKHVMLFKNNGGTAGASLLHPHSQIVALPVIPRQVEVQMKVCEEFYTKHGKSVFVQMAEEELEAGERVIERNEHFMAFVPFAAICPFETWILPLKSLAQHQAYFHAMSEEERKSFVAILHRTMRRLHMVLDEPNYNLIVCSAPVPNRVGSAAYNFSVFYSWQCRIFPRLGAGSMAGFEFGSGIFSNSNLPHLDASMLRDVQL
ncbi:hypothetical protein GUITHDRAFT_104991 [Guillardia theta CCMP2712]|uniref:Uncharacterized protein n=1 Tax=Guillardia theta (strain CCMP2712) TaxID=905079 RepID=L1JN10_GUITC|nr:hypothetical protein GUITHDRAFT_104991 [Guillardia theta CCMP2712]EKX49463.1 hypothetical protein GUITHDRAFT_104991 [Guillardia theta CCMP2712]|eukprot:XP_005836443.1 hypothetical protein GUITHDRAFT_104991 [Guillardia theta CCMP2712]